MMIIELNQNFNWFLISPLALAGVFYVIWVISASFIYEYQWKENRRESPAWSFFSNAKKDMLLPTSLFFSGSTLAVFLGTSDNNSVGLWAIIIVLLLMAMLILVMLLLGSGKKLKRWAMSTVIAMSVGGAVILAITPYHIFTVDEAVVGEAESTKAGHEVSVEMLEVEPGNRILFEGSDTNLAYAILDPDESPVTCNIEGEVKSGELKGDRTCKPYELTTE